MLKLTFNKNNDSCMSQKGKQNNWKDKINHWIHKCNCQKNKINNFFFSYNKCQHYQRIKNWKQNQAFQT